MPKLEMGDAARLLAEINAARAATRETIDGIFKRYSQLDTQAEAAELTFTTMVGELLGFAGGAGWTLDELLERIRQQHAATEQLRVLSADLTRA